MADRGHPVFKDKPIQFNPREVYIKEMFAQRGEYKVFRQYWQMPVQALFDTGVSRTCQLVNIDAVIAALLLKMLWQLYQSQSRAF